MSRASACCTIALSLALLASAASAVYFLSKIERELSIVEAMGSAFVPDERREAKAASGSYSAAGMVASVASGFALTYALTRGKDERRGIPDIGGGDADALRQDPPHLFALPPPRRAAAWPGPAFVRSSAEQQRAAADGNARTQRAAARGRVGMRDRTTRDERERPEAARDERVDAPSQPPAAAIRADDPDADRGTEASAGGDTAPADHCDAERAPQERERAAPAAPGDGSEDVVERPCARKRLAPDDRTLLEAVVYLCPRKRRRPSARGRRGESSRGRRAAESEADGEEEIGPDGRAPSPATTDSDGSRIEGDDESSAEDSEMASPSRPRRAKRSSEQASRDILAGRPNKMTKMH